MIRVTLVSPDSPVPLSLLAIIDHATTAPRMTGGRLEYGHVTQVLAECADPDALRTALRRDADGIAVAVVDEPLASAPARLLMLDVDSTLTTTEAIDLLAEHAGAAGQVAAITERAMRGELDFAASLRERVATLAGLPTAIFDEVAPLMTLSPGAENLIAAAKAAGAKVGVTSGGFTPLVAPLAERLGLDFFHANLLETETAGGTQRLTGRLTGIVVDRAQKAKDLRRFAAEHSIDLALSVAVGDGANDLDMLAAAGLGIAYCAKPVTAAAAGAAVPFPRLDAIVPLAFGMPRA